MLDSSVLVPRWSRIVLQRLAARLDAPYVPVWSEWIIAETWRVLTWQWVARAKRNDAAELRSLARAANDMLRYLVPVMRLVSLRDYAGPGAWPELADAEDVPLWQTAIISGAAHVISHNVVDFPPLVQGRHIYAGVEYLTVVEFVEDVLGIDLAEVWDMPLPRGGPLRSRRKH